MSSTTEQQDQFKKMFAGKKKKNPKLKTNEEVLLVGEDARQDLAGQEYSYDELLDRVYTIMRECNPNLGEGKQQRLVIRPPQVARVGTKKTSFTNFAEICKLLHRPERHLQQYILAELGTSGSLDANKALIIKGKFQSKHIENVLINYIREYVTCHTCKSPQTQLQKEDRLFFLQCDMCGARCSVASIKTGFQAVVGKRAAARAKIA
ncbi:hypothetical protein ACOME3_003492 [Neoechinorhynchus agilis]